MLAALCFGVTTLQLPAVDPNLRAALDAHELRSPLAGLRKRARGRPVALGAGRSGGAARDDHAAAAADRGSAVAGPLPVDRICHVDLAAPAEEQVAERQILSKGDDRFSVRVPEPALAIARDVAVWHGGTLTYEAPAFVLSLAADNSLDGAVPGR